MVGHRMLSVIFALGVLGQTSSLRFEVSAHGQKVFGDAVSDNSTSENTSIQSLGYQPPAKTGGKIEQYVQITKKEFAHGRSTTVSKGKLIKSLGGREIGTPVIVRTSYPEECQLLFKMPQDSPMVPSLAFFPNGISTMGKCVMDYVGAPFMTIAAVRNIWAEDGRPPKLWFGKAEPVKAGMVSHLKACKIFIRSLCKGLRHGVIYGKGLVPDDSTQGNQLISMKDGRVRLIDVGATRVIDSRIDRANGLMNFFAEVLTNAFPYTVVHKIEDINASYDDRDYNTGSRYYRLHHLEVLAEAGKVSIQEQSAILAEKVMLYFLSIETLKKSGNLQIHLRQIELWILNFLCAQPMQKEKFLYKCDA